MSYGHISFLVFILYHQCQSIFYNLLKVKVDRLRNKKVTIYPSALSYKREGATLRHFDFIVLDGNDEIGYFPWKFK